MRCFFAALLLSCPIAANAGDEGNHLYNVASGADFKHGRLELCAYSEDFLWLNGSRIETGNLLQDPEPWPNVVMKPGDVLTLATGCYYFDRQPDSKRTFEKYRLDRLTPAQADFTLSEYGAKLEPKGSLNRYGIGPLKSVVRFQVDLKQFGVLYESVLPAVAVGLPPKRTK